MSAAEQPPQRARRRAGAPEHASSNLEAVVAELAPLIAAHLAAATPDPEPLIDAAAAGALLGVPASWVLAQARAGAMPHVRLGHYVRFDRRELLEWRSAQASRPRTGSRPVPPAPGSPVNTRRTGRRGARGTAAGTK